MEIPLPSVMEVLLPRTPVDVSIVPGLIRGKTALGCADTSSMLLPFLSLTSLQPLVQPTLHQLLVPVSGPAITHSWFPVGSPANNCSWFPVGSTQHPPLSCSSDQFPCRSSLVFLCCSDPVSRSCSCFWLLSCSSHQCQCCSNLLFLLSCSNILWWCLSSLLPWPHQLPLQSPNRWSRALPPCWWQLRSSATGLWS